MKTLQELADCAASLRAKYKSAVCVEATRKAFAYLDTDNLDPLCGEHYRVHVLTLDAVDGHDSLESAVAKIAKDYGEPGKLLGEAQALRLRAKELEDQAAALESHGNV